MSRIAITILLSSTLLHAGDDAYRRAALEAGRWLESVAVKEKAGTNWPADPAQPATRPTNLYHGTAGVVLFFLEAHHATGDKRYLAHARAGADHLVASLPAKPEGAEWGLYTGVPGLGFALNETFRATGDERYRDSARRCIELLRNGGQAKGAGVEWNDTTDIIRGGAGIGLFLLYAAKEMKDPGALELAEAAGRRLLELGKPTEKGRRWAMTQTYPRLMPNFSHGTAGVAYYLAALHQATGKKEYLDAALAGARHLLSIAKTDADGCLIYHHTPEGEELFYLGWCHGPSGTGRLFHRLWQATNDKQWLEWARRAARSLLESGIPEKQTPGFWNNVGPCCGSAGVAEFMLGLHRATKEPAYLAFAKRVTKDLLARATTDDRGRRWIQAEHRVRPELLQAQTGYMQGAAGIGLWLLWLDAFQNGKQPRIVLPDAVAR